MPFKKGNPYSANRKGKSKDASKTIWLLDSLKQNGFDYESMLVKFLKKASDMKTPLFERKQAYDMAALLIKMVPHIAQAPKSDAGTTQIDTLVINSFREGPKGIDSSPLEIRVDDINAFGTTKPQTIAGPAIETGIVTDGQTSELRSSPSAPSTESQS